MNKKIQRILSVFTLLAILSLACNLSSPTNTSEPTQEKETPTPKVTSTPKSTPTEAITLGEEQRNDAGGFSFRPVPGYKVESMPGFGVTTMLAEGADPQVGPVVGMIGEMVDASKVKEVNDFFKVFKDGVNATTTISDPRPIMVDGKPGLESDVSENKDGKDLAGKVAVVLVSPTQGFTLVGAAEKDIWDKEVKAYFDAVLKTVKFFDMKIEIPTGLPDLPSEMPSLDITPEITLELPDADETQDSSDDFTHMFALASTGASSQFGENSWSASQALGAPNVETCGDSGNAWASLGSTTVEWIDLVFQQPVTPAGVIIYLSYNPNQVSKVELLDMLGQYHTIYTGTPKAEDQCPFLFKIEVSKADYQAIGIKITIDQSVLGNWGEIDAVELYGKP